MVPKCRESLAGAEVLRQDDARQDVGDARPDAEEESAGVAVIVGEIGGQIAAAFQLDDAGRAAVPAGAVEKQDHFLVDLGAFLATFFDGHR